MINNHIILTLKKSEYRHWTAWGATTAMGTPHNQVEFFTGYNDDDYGNDMTLIANAAEEDGYPFVRNFAGNINTEFVHQNPGSVCQFWNFARMMEYIIDSNQVALVTWDDRTLTIPFQIIDKITTELNERPEPFYMWQLRIRSYNDLAIASYNRTDVTDEQLQIYGNHDVELLFKKSIRGYVDSYYDSFLQKGLLGYDESIVVSPLGAKWWLDQMKSMIAVDTTSTKRLPGEYRDRFDAKWHERSMLNIDNWIAWGLYDSLHKIVESGIGIYCPSNVAYSFVDDWLPMGSAIDWALKTIPNYEELQKNTTLNYLEIL